LRVLIVEDERLLLDALTRSFREEGYAVDSAADGTEGLYKAKSWDYDLIVLDVMLPERDGVEDRVRGLDTGADDYVVKPFEIEELLARARALIRRSTGNADPLIRLGGVTIDTASRRVAKDEREVALTAREYALVEILALNRGKVVTRTMLYEHLCDENDDTISKVIEVHVSNVRRKLGKDFIATRRGHGYIIENDV
jgi:two-component system OmpR family response regulator